MRLLVSYCILKYIFASFFVSSSTSVIPGYGDETRRLHRFFAASASTSTSRHLRKRNQQRQAATEEKIYFVYSKAPEHLIIPARRSGVLERISFTNSASKMSDEDEKMELYARHFSQCAQINHDKEDTNGENDTEVAELENEFRDDAAIDETAATKYAKKSVDANSPIDVLTDAIGVDVMTAKLFAISSPSLLAKTIRRTCLKNELKFQCAFGFLDNIGKIQEHIDLMKQNDGNFKVMLESECIDKQSPDAEHADARRSVYTCVNKNAAQILQRCAMSIETYNSTRKTINAKMQDKFLDTLTAIENHVEKAIASRDSDELERVLNKGEALMAKTLRELANSEAFKCHQFALMERCVVEETKRECSAHAARNLRTILRVGYLARERGATLNHHFSESNVREHRACRKFTDASLLVENDSGNEMMMTAADENRIDRISA